MHADYRLLKKQIMEERKNMSEQEFFTSDDYTNYQLGMARAATRRYYSNLNMQMGWDESPNANVACTNNKRIYENAANPLTRELPTWYLKSLSLTGLTGHECGHLLYTDFTSSILYGTSMKRGSFYPELPEAPDYPQNKTELLAAIADKKEVVCKTLARCAHSLCNVLEDVYIEARICQEFPGTFQLGIGLLNDQFAEQMPSIQQQIKDGYNGYSIMVNLIIQYCKAGDLNNVTGYSGEYLDYLDACIPYIENSMYDTDTRKRFSAVNEMLVILWEYIKPLIEEAEKQKDEQQAKKFLDNLDKTLSGQIASGAPLPDLTGGAKAASDVTVTGKALSAGKTAAESLMQEENDRISRIPLQEMDIEGLSEATLEKFLALGYLSSFTDIYHLDRYAEQIKALEGFGEKSYARLDAAINTSRNTNFVRYLVAMDIPMIGRTKSRILDQVFCGNLEMFRNAAVGNYDFTNLEDFGEILDHNIHDWFFDEDNLKLWDELQTEFTFEKRKEETTMMKENVFTGCTIVATGKLENFSRNEINDKILELGAKPGSSVTKNTDYVVFGEKAGSKLAKAQQLGIKTLSENEFLAMIA